MAKVPALSRPAPPEDLDRFVPAPELLEDQVQGLVARLGAGALLRDRVVEEPVSEERRGLLHALAVGVEELRVVGPALAQAVAHLVEQVRQPGQEGGLQRFR